MSQEHSCCDHHSGCPHHGGQDCHDACCLRLEGLGVAAADGQQLLHDVDLHIHCGEIVSVIGPNGAGKSTLFKAILGQQPYTGTIHFETSGGHPARPKVGYVPQSPSFDAGDPLTVLDLFVSAGRFACPFQRPCGTKCPPAWSGSMARPCWTAVWELCPVASFSGSCWLWRWNPCPTFSFWTSPCPV